jgi:tetratricopeptide (TPR) repeat protein
LPRLKIYLSFFICANFILLAACGKQADHGTAASASLASAQKLYDAGQYQAARAEIDAIIKADPKMTEAHFLAGEIAEKSGDLKTAVDEYVSAGTEKSRLAAAALLIRARAYSSAEEWIAISLADRPGDTAMKAYRALLAQRLGDSRKARADAATVLSKDTGNVIANAVLAEEALGRKDPAYALNIIETGLTTDPADKDLLRLKAQAFLQQEQPEKAIQIYKDLVSSDPTIPEYRVILAEQLARNSKVDQGEQVLRDGVAAAPGNIEMHIKLISFLAQHRDEKAVTKELISAIASTPQSTVYDIALADVYAKTSGFDAAAKVLNDAIKRAGPGQAHADAQLAFARLLIAHDDTAAARPILDGMLKANPADDGVLAVRGQLLLKDHNPAAAIQDFLSIAARQPANTAVFGSLAEAYLQNDQRKEAIAALKRILSLAPSDLAALRRIVEVQSIFGDFADAGRIVDDFLFRNPASIDARVVQVQLAAQTKDWGAADAALARLRNIPASEQRAAALDAGIREARGLSSDAAEMYKKLISNENSRFDVSVARAFARTSILAGKSSPAIETLSSFETSVGQADLGAYDLILASLYDSLGQQDKVGQLVSAAIRAAPASPAPYIQQAVAFSRKKDVPNALAILDRGIATGVPKEPLLLARAQIQRSDGRIDDAILTYREILRANPKSVVGANELADILADQQPLNKAALREARDLLQNNATFKSPAIVDTLAWSDYRLEDFAKAKDLLSSVDAEHSTLPQLRFHYGAVVIALGDRANGQNIIRETLNDNYPGRKEAARLVSD